MQLGPILFTNPWGLLSLFSIPAILGIYFFRQTFDRKEISAMFLWEKVSRSRSSGSRLDRPPFSWNLLLQLLIAFLLSLLIAGPQLRTRQKHHIILIDHSASMHAEQSGGRTSFEKAVSGAQDKLADLSSGARVTMLTTGHTTNRIGSDMMDPRTAQDLLNDLEPGYQSFDPEKTIQQAYHLAGSASILYFYTDRPPASYDGPLPDRFHWHAVGEPLNNIAWTNAHRTSTSDGQSRIFVQLKNYSKRHRTVQVRFRLEDRVLNTKQVSMKAGDSWQSTAEFDLASKVLTVDIQGVDDPLSLDDRIVLRPPYQKRVRAGMFGLNASNRQLVRKALSSVKHVHLFDYSTKSELVKNADVLIGPARTVPSSYRGVYLGVRNLDEEQVQQQSFVRGPYFMDHTHPLVRNIVLSGLVFGGVRVDQAPSYHTAFLSAGNTPLLYRRPTGTSRQFHANFDPHYSTIQNSVAWPMLVTNLTDIARNDLPGPVRSNFRMDEAVQLSTQARGGGASATEASWTLQFPFGENRSFEPGQQVRVQDLSGPPGTYILRRSQGDKGKKWPFRVNFLNQEESNLLDLGEGEKYLRETTAQARSRWTEVRPLKLSMIILLALLCVMSWLVADRTGGGGSL